eukprot:TRINITY_DN18233_c0_g1_i1.p1 TRINITY_DN18233_c0_g1~~TRINITY_DN18233_c0_g1_i1.p1  ORF type:complete len:268 (+),score=47.47 TRINITY_DN18233_c0_g1_i1:67-870(+)
MAQVDVQTQIKVFDSIFDQVWLGDHVVHSASLPSTVKQQAFTRVNSAPPVSRAHMLKEETFRSRRNGGRHDRKVVHQMVNEMFSNVIKSQKELEQQERRKAREAKKMMSKSARFDLGEKIAVSFRRTFSANAAKHAEIVAAVLVEEEEQKDTQTDSNIVAPSTTASGTESATVSADGAGNLQEVQDEHEVMGENTGVVFDIQEVDNQGDIDNTNEINDEKENINNVNIAIGALPLSASKDSKKKPKASHDPQAPARVFCVGCFGCPY